MVVNCFSEHLFEVVMTKVNNTRMSLVLAGMLATALVLVTAQPAIAQYKSYAQAYQQNAASNPGVNYGTSRYLYQKYFQSNPAVSPYLSGAILGRSDSGTAYYTQIRPEQQRRESAAKQQAQYIQQRKLQGNIGHTVYPGGPYGGYGAGTYQPNLPPARTNGAYQNHWYGAWNR
jgi:hypothetical protein